jgi:hypothetical protein
MLLSAFSTICGSADIYIQKLYIICIDFGESREN